MMAAFGIEALRAFAVARSLFPATSLEAAIRTLGFVQLDPIRAPARAQDLVLRHRVEEYRNGDLESRYPDLPVIEDHVHVYGVMPRETRRLLHPRAATRRFAVESEHPQLLPRVLAHVRKHGATHPRDLQRAFGAQKSINGWGGQSAATTRVLALLHYRGMLRVALRVKGIRVYDLETGSARAMAAAARASGLIRLLLRLYAPVGESSLHALAAMIDTSSLPERARATAIARVIRSGWAAIATVDGERYFWPADESTRCEPNTALRLLAPFDPVVWDRRRFERLWGWPYRFEAYTPAARRRFGYYALPMLWRDAVIGWANVAASGGRLDVALGFAGKRPRDAAFRRELDAELARFAAFLGLDARAD
jgi:hypothetical protein